MKNEKILYANDTDIAIEGMTAVIEKYGAKDGHQIIATARSKEEVEELFKEGLNPTVFIFDPSFPYLYDGADTVKMVRKLSPATKIITISEFEGIDIGDVNLVASVSSETLIEILNKLKH